MVLLALDRLGLHAFSKGQKVGEHAVTLLLFR
jgi:hypothetical protein